MNVRCRVDLTQFERNKLGELLSGGKHPSRKLKRAQILLAADAGVSDEDIAVSVGVGGSIAGLIKIGKPLLGVAHPPFARRTSGTADRAACAIVEEGA